MSNKWAQLADMPVAVDHISSAVIVTGNRIIYLGGETSHNVLSDGVFAYTPATNTWAMLTSLPEGKSAGVAAVLNGNIYYTGGNFSAVNHKGVPILVNQVTLSPLADAYVRDGNFSSLNFGSDTALVIKGSVISNYSRYFFIKFSLTSVNNITSATLRIYGSNTDNTSAINVDCYGINDDTWAENSISFNNAPAQATAALSTVGISNQMLYYEFDITSFIKNEFAGNKIASMLLKDPANKNSTLLFHSKESNSNKPQLLISSN